MPTARSCGLRVDSVAIGPQPSRASLDRLANRLYILRESHHRGGLGAGRRHFGLYLMRCSRIPGRRLRAAASAYSVPI